MRKERKRLISIERCVCSWHIASTVLKHSGRKRSLVLSSPASGSALVVNDQRFGNERQGDARGANEKEYVFAPTYREKS